MSNAPRFDEYIVSDMLYVMQYMTEKKFDTSLLDMENFTEMIENITKEYYNKKKYRIYGYIQEFCQWVGDEYFKKKIKKTYKESFNLL